MSNEKLDEIKNVLQSINASIPDETSVYDIENKLDKIVELLERQIELSENIDNNSGSIERNLPETTYVNTSTMENRLEQIWNKLDELNDNLSQISYNTGN